MPTRDPRIQVTEDPELSRALGAASPPSPEERERSEELRYVAELFDEPEAAGLDWDALREGKRAWPLS